MVPSELVVLVVEAAGRNRFDCLQVEEEMLSVKKAQDIRLAVRAVVLCAVAFGLGWSADQVAAVMLATEAVLRLGVKDA